MWWRKWQNRQRRIKLNEVFFLLFYLFFPRDKLLTKTPFFFFKSTACVRYFQTFLTFSYGFPGHAEMKGSRAGPLDQERDWKQGFLAMTTPLHHGLQPCCFPPPFSSHQVTLSIFLSSILLNSACIKRPRIHWKKGHGRPWVCLSTWEMLARVVLISSSPPSLTGDVFWETKKIFFLPLASSLALFRIIWTRTVGQQGCAQRGGSAQLLPTQPFFTSAS